MTMFQYISQNIDKIKLDCKIGIVPCSVLTHYAIYAKFDYYRKAGCYVNEAVFNVSQDYNMGQSTIFSIIKKMESDI